MLVHVGILVFDIVGNTLIALAPITWYSMFDL